MLLKHLEWSNTIGGTAAGAGNIISGNAGDGIKALDPYADFIQGNTIGLNAAGTAAVPNAGWGISALYHKPATTSHGGHTTSYFSSSTGSNMIGGPDGGNVVSGNTSGGILITGGVLDVVSANIVGLNAAGTAAIANGGDGIQSVDGKENTIGGTAAGSGNVIAGNASNNIEIDGDSSDRVAGNYIGINEAGTAGIGGGDDGVLINSASQITVGGTAAGAANVISGNPGDGIEISGVTAVHNVVVENVIGLNAAGTAAIANAGAGVMIDGGASYNLVGNIVSGSHSNVISGNSNYGIEIYGPGSSYNTIVGNWIGLNAAGTAAVGNSSYGIFVYGSYGNTLGGTASGAGNVISGNDGGINLEEPSDLVVGNFIGTNPAGTVAIGNGSGDGIDVNWASNTIGGTASGFGNLISANVVGISIDGIDDTLVEGNLIGTNDAGTAALGNTEAGIIVDGGASGDTIGGSVTGAGNLISGNTGDGIAIDDLNTTGNLVEGNLIGTNLSGHAAVPNTVVGVDIYQGPTYNTIGGTATGGAQHRLGEHARRHRYRRHRSLGQRRPGKLHRHRHPRRGRGRQRRLGRRHLLRRHGQHDRRHGHGRGQSHLREHE